MEKKRMSSFKLHTGENDGRQLGNKWPEPKQKAEKELEASSEQVANKHPSKYANELLQHSAGTKQRR